MQRVRCCNCGSA